MAKNKISEFSSTAANNTDIANINIAEGCAPSGINNAIRELMAQLKDQQTGADGDNFTVGGNLSVTGTATGVTPAVTDDTTKFATTAFVRDIIPSGVIVMWSGSVATIPTGWLLCDGANSTPDLRNSFIIGANADDAGVAKTNITGSATQTGGYKDAIVVSHTHTADAAGIHNHSYTTFTVGGPWIHQSSGGFAQSDTLNSRTTGDAGSHTHTIASTGSSGTNANLPPYYALAYIMKS
jgi:microcystin-dependent protein